MTASVVVIVVAVVAVCVAAYVGWRIGRGGARTADAVSTLRSATSSEPEAILPGENADLRNQVASPAELLEPGTEIVDGRMSKAALLALIVQSTETGIAVVDEHRDVVLFNKRADALGLVHDHLLDDHVWQAARTVLDTGTDLSLIHI